MKKTLQLWRFLGFFLAVSLAGPVLAAAQSVWLEDLTWQEIAARQQQGATSVMIPTGGTEQNGPHMALGKHHWVVHYAAQEIATTLGTMLVAPVIDYVPEGSINPPDGHMRFPGTISLREETFAALLEDAARSLKQGGFRRIYFMGDHGGNQNPQTAVAEKLSKEWAKEDVRVVSVKSYYTSDSQMPDGAHAGLNDTAQLLAVHPQAVRREKINHYTAADYESLGVQGDPSDATATLGKQVLAKRTAAALAEIKTSQ